MRRFSFSKKIAHEKTTDPYTSWKLPVRVATTAPLMLSGIQTVDGILLTIGDRILVKDQTNGIQNGIYVVKQFAWLRSNDLKNGAKTIGCFFYVGEGTANSGKVFVCTNISGSDIVGVNILVFTQFGGPPSSGYEQMLTIRTFDGAANQLLTTGQYNIIDQFLLETNSVSSTLGTITWDTDHFVCPVTGMYRVTVSLPFVGAFPTGVSFEATIYAIVGIPPPSGLRNGVFQGIHITNPNTSNNNYTNNNTNLIPLTFILPVTALTNEQNFIRIVIFVASADTPLLLAPQQLDSDYLGSFNQVVVELLTAKSSQNYPTFPLG